MFSRYKFLSLLLINIIHSEVLEVFESKQIYSSSKSIGTILYINLFNHLPISIQISGVVEHCCVSMNHCITVRILGGDFGEWKSHKNRSLIFFWSGLEWENTIDHYYCQISLLFGPRKSMTHLQIINIKINYIPKRRQIITGSNNPYSKCNHFLNIRTNQCETLDELRKKFSYNTSSLFTPFNHRYLPTKCINGIQLKDCYCHQNYISIPINQKLYHPKTYIHHLCTHLSNDGNLSLNLLIIITFILFLFYLILITISSIFICTYYRRREHKESNLIPNQRFSLVELSSELQLNHSSSCT